MTPALRRRLRRVLAHLEHVWGVPGLAAGTEVEFSPRLSVSLGRTSPERRLVRLRADLERAPSPLLDEILTHEFAHVAVWARYGAGARPHGSEWRALVRAAGHEPRTRIDARGLQLLEPVPRTRAIYVHSCPVCLGIRRARRPMHRSRCTACREAGFSGELVIERANP